MMIVGVLNLDSSRTVATGRPELLVVHHILDIRRQSIVVCYANHILLAAVNHKNRNPQQFGVLLRQPLFRSAPNNAKKE